MSQHSNRNSCGWVEGVGPLLVLLALMADRWLPAKNASTSDLAVFLLGVIAAAGYWGGLRSALASAALLVGTSFYAQFFAPGDGSFDPRSWIHLGALLTTAVTVSVVTGLSRGGASPERGEEWRSGGSERPEESIRRVDMVTGLPNRRLCLQLAQLEWERWRRFATPFSVLIVEMDGFESIRRSDSSLADSMLRVFANQMTSVLRSMDVAGRFEDGQFLVVLPQTSYAGSLVAGEKLLKIARQTRMDGHGGDFGATFSIGAAGVERSDDQLKDLLQRAVEAQRRARAVGGDSILGDGASAQESALPRS